MLFQGSTSDLAPEDLIWITAMNQMNKRPRSDEATQYVHLWLPPGQNTQNTDKEDKIWIRMREQSDGTGLYVIETQNVDGFEEVGPGYKLAEGKNQIKQFLYSANYKGPKLVYRYVPEKVKNAGGTDTAQA